MPSLSQLILNLKSDFLSTLADLQAGRAIWLFIAAVALFMEVFSWAFFQTLLNLRPCELCVYIRFSMLAICVGALIASIQPRLLLMRLAGYAITGWWVVQGFLWSLRLHQENIKAADPDWISPCSASTANFPFGLKLDQWFPAHFKPQMVCGEDSAWTLLGFSMPEWLYLVYGCFALLLLLMFFSWAIQAFRR